MLDKVRQTIDQNGLLTPGDRVLAALSGGPDSVALLHCLFRLRDEYRLDLTAVYINHGLRPEATDEEQFCRSLCRKIAVSFRAETLDVPHRAKENHESIELAARHGRYEILSRLAESLSSDRIALGHHRNDQIETVLHRIIRGSGIDGLSGIPIRRGRIIRPLLYQSRETILAYLEKHRLSYCTDDSNESEEFTRNYIRNRLLPQLRSDLNPGVDRALWNLSETAAADSELLAEIVAGAVRKSTSRTPGGKIEVDLRRFRAYAPSLRWRILRYCLTERMKLRPAVDRAVIERCDELAMKGGTAVSLPDRVQARIVNERLLLYRKLTGPYEMSLDLDRKLVMDCPSLSFRARERSGGMERISRKRRARQVTLDLRKVKLPLVVRSIRPGDRFRPLGMRGTRRIADWLSDKKVAAVYRDEIPVVCDRKGIVWLVGYEIADRVKVDENTDEVIEIECAHRRHRTEAAS